MKKKKKQETGKPAKKESPKLKKEKGRKRRDTSSGKYASVPVKRTKVSLKKRKALKKAYLLGDKVVMSSSMKDGKGDGVLHLKKKETVRSQKYTWED